VRHCGRDKITRERRVTHQDFGKWVLPEIPDLYVIWMFGIVSNTATGKPRDSFGRMGRRLCDFDNKLPQSFFRFPSELTLPNGNHTPPNLSQLRLLVTVSLDVCVELVLPAFGIAGWRRGVAATLMSVPETSMNEDGDSVLREH
jgi:hypothetical protein